MRQQMLDRLDSELAFNRSALNLRSYRQELLASNIANADTPHFKARDIEFKSALADVMAGRTQGDLALARTSTRHLTGADGSRYGVELKYRAEYQGAVDGNTVNMDVERSAFAENAVQTEALITFVRDQFQQMTNALNPGQ
ncbi:MAG TPA: flagellar basal body rod protein FlgB [Rhodocyclaceae bacterium]